MLCASTGPTSATSCSAASSAAMSASSRPKCRASSFAVASPTWRIPRAKMNRASVVLRLLSMAATTLAADFSAMRSSSPSAATPSLYRSAGVRTMCPPTSCSTSFSPRPSMSMARRPAKCSSACATWAGQTRPPEQRAIVSSGRRTTAEPHSGHFFGSANSRVPCGRFSFTTRTISGITSPARRTITVSPTRTSLRRTSSSLCSVALVTVTPPTNTGFRRATGVSAPVRPTWTSMASTSVAISSAGNLCASAKRGARET